MDFSSLSVYRSFWRLCLHSGTALARPPNNLSYWMNAMNANLIPSASHCQFCSFPVIMSKMGLGFQKILLVWYATLLSSVFYGFWLWEGRGVNLIERSLHTTSQVQELSLIPFFSKPQYFPFLKRSAVVHGMFLYKYYAKEIFYQCRSLSLTFPYQHF